jgi:CRISPR-associated protein Cas2
MTRRQLERMRWELEKELAPEDSLMIAGLCSGCASRMIARNTRVEWVEQERRFRVV